MSGVAQAEVLGQRIRLNGRVQGVGMRPTLWRLARQQQLAGSVCNDAAGVVLELWGSASRVEQLLVSLQEELPPLARIDSLHREPLYEEGPADFRIRASGDARPLTAVLPDAATCPECLAEVLNPAQRRYRYPFASCTHCGPRLSIQRSLPWDRQRTSMAAFPLCRDCEVEYRNPEDRRFHAQPIACAECGPRVWLADVQGDELPHAGEALDALDAAAHLLEQGAILAIKGLGGFHLACDAANTQSVARLRQAKHRDAKPFALMARDLSVIGRYVQLDSPAIDCLQSPAAPIVLLPRLGKAPELAEGLAPGLDTLGFMLPSTPLHHLLLQGFERPLVMTSGNLSGEPPCIDNDEAVARLGPVVDALLLHNRAIINRLDDSVWRVVNSEPRALRLARGYAPEHVPLPPGLQVSTPVLALGGELKASFCLLRENGAELSQHIGELSSVANLEDYQRAQQRYETLFDTTPGVLVADRHPNYQSTLLGEHRARQESLPLLRVQHHHAHIAACMAENHLPVGQPAVLGVSLDGLGYGEDGELWGGEILLADYRGYRRLACLEPMPLIGGEQAMREPWRNCLAHLISTLGWEPFLRDFGDLPLAGYLQNKPVSTLQQVLQRQLNCPLSSSAGRWFDAVAAALGLCAEMQEYEGQAAMQLESLAGKASPVSDAQAYHLPTKDEGGLRIIQALPLWQALLNDLKMGVAREVIAARFHEGLALSLADTLQGLMQTCGCRPVVLSGGVFQNAILLGRLETLLKQRAVTVYSHRRVPANDGGLALGQAMVAAARLSDRSGEPSLTRGAS